MAKHKSRILFYYHHFGGLGHGTRIAAICRELHTMGHHDIVVINSGSPQPELNIDQFAKVINLPPFKAQESLFTGLSADDDIQSRFAKRKEYLDKLQQAFKPDVFVVEHYPFGRNVLNKELIWFIEQLKKDGCRIYSSVRDIIEQTLDEEELKSRFPLFDGILVHSDKDMGFVTSFHQQSTMKEKLFFTGRIVSQQNKPVVDPKLIRQKYFADDRKWIVVSAGGGIDGFEFLERLIRLKDSIDQSINCTMSIFTGPNIPEERYQYLLSIAQKQARVFIKKFDFDYRDCIDACDLAITMAGYNSINDALCSKTSALVFPRSTDREQSLRAEFFSKFVGIVDMNLTDHNLIDLIVQQIGKRKSPYSGDMNGAIKTARLLDVASDMNSLKIRLDTECNLFCEMCSWKKQTIALPQGAFEKILLRARIAGVRMIALTGGEPTMLPDIAQKLKFIKDNGFRLSLSTNGYLESNRLLELVPYIDDVDISIDSHDPKEHDRIRGKVGAFEKSMSSIRLLAQSGLLPHINVTVRPDNFNGLHKMVGMFVGLSRSMSFTLVDTTMIKQRTDRYLFSDDQLVQYYFKELIAILKECLKFKIDIRISPFFDDLKSRDPKVILTALVSDPSHFQQRFREIFQPNGKSCSIPREYLRINPSGELVFCCFQDDSGESWGNVFENDLCDIVVSDGYFQFVNNAVEGKDPCWMCKKTYKANYGEEAACVK